MPMPQPIITAPITMENSMSCITGPENSGWVMLRAMVSTVIPNTVRITKVLVIAFQAMIRRITLTMNTVVPTDMGIGNRPA